MRLFSFVLFGVLLVKFLNCVQTAINYKYLHSFVRSVVSCLRSCQKESWFIHCQGSVFAFSWIIVFTVDVEWVETCFPVREVSELGTVRMCVCARVCICCFNIWLVLQQSRGLDQGKCAAAWWKAAPPLVPSDACTLLTCCQNSSSTVFQQNKSEWSIVFLLGKPGLINTLNIDHI